MGFYKNAAAVLGIISTILVTGCGTETIIHKVDEKEANEIIVLLAENDITASKGMVDTGRSVHFTISVAAKNKLPSMQILKDNDHPRRQIAGYREVFSEGGLIPTAAEEKAKRLRAIEGEVEKQLTLVGGILDVEANIVMPEVNPLKTTEEASAPTTASVTIKYLPGGGGSKPLSEPQIQAIVAAAVEKLTPDHVVVVMTPARPPPVSAQGDSRECPPGAAVGNTKGFCCRLSARSQTGVLAAVIGLVLILSLGLVFGQIRLRSVRGRLIRLQNEIAKARRKAGGGEASLAPQP